MKVTPYFAFGGECAPRIMSFLGSRAEGGEVTMPVEPSFFAPRFGTVSDCAGVAWMVICAPEP